MKILEREKRLMYNVHNHHVNIPAIMVQATLVSRLNLVTG